MSSLEVDEVLFAYIAVAPHAMSLVLVQVNSGIQRPIYYVRKLLHEVEVRYLPLEKAILAVVHATRKLPHYFQSHTIVGLTQLPLRSLLRSVDYIGRIVKWGTILRAFDIKYMPRPFVKGQVLVDLVVEFAESPLEEKNIYVDRATNQRGSRVELVLVSPEKITIEKSMRLDFSAINNEAEYEGLLVGMTMVQKMGEKAIEIFSDSRLVVGQVKGELEARDVRMQEYLNQAETLNKVIVNGLKKRLDDMKEKWVEMLSHVLWTYWTTPRRSTGETPFSMTYGAKAVIPLEMGILTLQANSFTSSNNDELLEKSLDLIEE
ncbi:uncharacterized protein LOC136062949 [Quercus suber]|uniref:uncharacterized protein LOC136062949 n=1 Tax=Quercus suber TaxID=58331 RepID=UPI0032E03663